MNTQHYSVNPHSGELVVRGADPALLTTLAAHLGRGVDLDCGECPPPQAKPDVALTEEATNLQVAGFVHQSMVDGPGLRSVVFCQGCDRQCAECRSSNMHDPRGGSSMTLEQVLAELLRPDQPRDGVTISGGEPLIHPDACAELVAQLKDRGIHVLVYSGFTYEELVSSPPPGLVRVLALADVLIDGPFVATLRNGRLRYRGSSNQRIIDLKATRKARGLRLLDLD